MHVRLNGVIGRLGVGSWAQFCSSAGQALARAQSESARCPEPSPSAHTPSTAPSFVRDARKYAPQLDGA